MRALLEPQKHCWRQSPGRRQQHQARPAPGSRGSTELRIIASVKASRSAEDRLYLSPEYTTWLLPTCFPSPHPPWAHFEAAQDRCPHYHPTLACHRKAEPSLEHNGSYGYYCKPAEEKRKGGSQETGDSQGQPPTHLSGHSPRGHGRPSGRAPALGR